MKYSAIRPALAALAASLTGISAASIAWKGSKEAALYRKFPLADLSLRSAGSIGRDEERREDDPSDDTKTQVVTNGGVRKLVWTVRIYTDDGSDGGIALGYADRFRVALKRSSSGAALRAVGVAFADMQDTQTVDGVKIQDRLASVAVVDVNLNAVDSLTDDSPDAGEYIERVIIQSADLVDVDGNASAKQLDAEIAK